MLARRWPEDCSSNDDLLLDEAEVLVLSTGRPESLFQALLSDGVAFASAGLFRRLEALEERCAFLSLSASCPGGKTCSHHSCEGCLSEALSYVLEDMLLRPVVCRQSLLCSCGDKLGVTGAVWAAELHRELDADMAMWHTIVWWTDGMVRGTGVLRGVEGHKQNPLATNDRLVPRLRAENERP